MNKNSKIIINLTILAIIGITAVLSASSALATGEDIAKGMLGGIDLFALPSGGDDPNTRLEIVTGKIIETFLSIMGVLFLSLMVYGGYKWMIAQGRDEEITKAKSIIRSAIIGLGIVLIAYAITYFVVYMFVKASSTT
ncbi:MAG: hypothetical protein A3J62_01135 [Candidatus Buchananbacteria bacterium RIFCSPHIGHO2_02_FULL_38_8]|uniref:DUF2976 domain-containing protein n=2 Tax=Candidatus Buchananiibacteriota TaxID=1817903 RepID=A0A1G1XXC5_9BACT|nr:MAG: hypothetical protein A2731_03135 [Candidatus Buchananbacteria bacterium RIFCSPHIGHO2_01_FULL_39_8]OGY47546.1 MAG: hypothetical protein A3J62_01135 [Candidatus Buchananbacteria bacterium RIFCSPHIGHO2_02_FULL_38_8]